MYSDQTTMTSSWWQVCKATGRTGIILTTPRIIECIVIMIIDIKMTGTNEKAGTSIPQGCREGVTETVEEISSGWRIIEYFSLTLPVPLQWLTIGSALWSKQQIWGWIRACTSDFGELNITVNGEGKHCEETRTPENSRYSLNIVSMTLSKVDLHLSYWMKIIFYHNLNNKKILVSSNIKLSERWPYLGSPTNKKSCKARQTPLGPGQCIELWPNLVLKETCALQYIERKGVD